MFSESLIFVILWVLYKQSFSRGEREEHQQVNIESQVPHLPCWLTLTCMCMRGSSFLLDVDGSPCSLLASTGSPGMGGVSMPADCSPSALHCHCEEGTSSLLRCRASSHIPERTLRPTPVEQGRTLCYFWVSMKARHHPHPMVSVDMKDPSLFLAFSHTNPGRHVGVPFWIFAGVEIRLFTWPLPGKVQLGPQVFLRCLARIGLIDYCPEVICFARLPFSSSFGWEKCILLFGGFYVHPCWCFEVSSFFSLSWGYVREKKAQGT